MKARLKYLVPGTLLVVIQVIPWALGAPASHFSTIFLAVGVLYLLNELFNAYRREERLREAHARARKTLNAQTVAIARLQALLHRRSPR